MKFYSGEMFTDVLSVTRLATFTINNRAICLNCKCSCNYR